VVEYGVVFECFPVSEAHYSSQRLEFALTVFDDSGFVDLGPLLEHVLHLFRLHAMPAHL
jgi:hypothetical protein